ncbi:hypothetical protein CAPTEDRAFT_170033 [Capitella teleta]|uniref:receptor protein-tyrosine kinase n=1 Tax=Capitella teleta TaxID=283909 RepID=R7TSF3_CAPTE|nr:hypothetical protein CAPTEDRAFT_170033 [Capitella teleta]|eukprot:ELT93960.1 hypothetical protein CAPTEDRAFT_170033 [Capitella teleta]
MATNLISLLVAVITMTSTSAGRGPPTIPTDAVQVRQVHRAGSNLRLMCPAIGDPEPLLGWEKDGEAINAGWERFRVAQSSLRIKAVAEDDSGKYVCKATNGFGSATLEYWLFIYPDTNDTAIPPFPSDFGGSPSQELDVFPEIDGVGEAPQFVNPRDMQSSHLVKPKGSTIRLRCRANGRPKPDIRWFHNGALLPEQPSVDDDGSKSDKWTLKLSAVSDDHDGRYTCRVQNRAGAINFTYYVEVVEQLQERPVLVSPHPTNRTVSFGGTASFQCSVRSDVEPHIQWLKRVDTPLDLRLKNTTIEVDNEQFIVLKTGLDIQRQDGTYLNKLTIYDAVEHDSGMYICLGANSMGYNLRSAYLTVLPNPNRDLTAFDDQSPSSPQSPALALIIGLPAVIVLVVIVLTIFLLHRFCSAPKAASKAPPPRQRSPPAEATSYGMIVGAPPPHDKMYDHQYMALRPQQAAPVNGYGQQHSAGSDNSHKNYAHSDSSSNANKYTRAPMYPQQQPHLTQPMLPPASRPYAAGGPGVVSQAPPQGGGGPGPANMHYHYGC